MKSTCHCVVFLKNELGVAISTSLFLCLHWSMSIVWIWMCAFLNAVLWVFLLLCLCLCASLTHLFHGTARCNGHLQWIKHLNPNDTDKYSTTRLFVKQYVYVVSNIYGGYSFIRPFAFYIHCFEQVIIITRVKIHVRYSWIMERRYTKLDYNCISLGCDWSHGKFNAS